MSPSNTPQQLTLLGVLFIEDVITLRVTAQHHDVLVFPDQLQASDLPNLDVKLI